ncbi:globin domain-containing protein [Streptomyces sp. NPDC047028]|uniref:globin domain-containing protein n=1 Tax=Streptomyces sp. NPDC047028 TaxID=3155793 RepID=UPI00340C2F2B
MPSRRPVVVRTLASLRPAEPPEDDADVLPMDSRTFSSSSPGIAEARAAGGLVGSTPDHVPNLQGTGASPLYPQSCPAGFTNPAVVLSTGHGHPGPDTAEGLVPRVEDPAPGPGAGHALPGTLLTPPPEPSADALVIQRTLASVEPVSDQATSYFYALLFTYYPALRDLFPVSMSLQRDRLFKALLTAATYVDDTVRLIEYLSELGRGHRKYGTRPEHYPAVGECLLAAMAHYAAEVWDAEAEAAWRRVYAAISQIMTAAAAVDELSAPPWWQAEVVAHEQRAPDIAVITVRPDQPYHFSAGQYASIETPWWPRVWRHYSFASAPRPDGTLTFHVKAVPTGWVSTALVNRARCGDVIRLGPPAGSMSIDRGSPNGLLCLGGGTGIAPIKALVEEAIEHGTNRVIDVVYSARQRSGLYAIDTLLGLQNQHRWLTVHPLMCERPAFQLADQLPVLLSSHGRWQMHDAYLSGPPEMISSSVDALVAKGVPSHRIHFDGAPELSQAS